MGEIAITRSLGDRVYKDYLTCEPDIYKFNINDFKDNDLLLLGTDGYWNVNTFKLILIFRIFLLKKHII